MEQDANPEVLAGLFAAHSVILKALIDSHPNKAEFLERLELYSASIIATTAASDLNPRARTAARNTLARLQKQLRDRQ